MAHFKLMPAAHGPRSAWRLQRGDEAAFCGSLDPVDPAPAVRFTFGNLEPMTFSSVSTWKRWFIAQGHTVETLP